MDSGQHQVALHGLEVALEPQGARNDAGHGGQPPHPHGPGPAAQNDALPVRGQRGQRRRRFGRGRGVPRVHAAADAATVRGGAELGEALRADGRGDPVQHAREELRGEGAGEVAPGDALKGCGRVAATAVGDGGAECEGKVGDEERVADHVGEANVGG